MAHSQCQVFFSKLCGVWGGATLPAEDLAPQVYRMALNLGQPAFSLSSLQGLLVNNHHSLDIVPEPTSIQAIRDNTDGTS